MSNMILCLRTDKKEAYVALMDNGEVLASESWEAHKELSNTLLLVIEKLLTSQQKQWSDIGGIVLFKGPGSFTGLRIGATVANTLASSLSVPIVGSQSEQWVDSGLSRLGLGESDGTVAPEYGAEANITKPRK